MGFSSSEPSQVSAESFPQAVKEEMIPVSPCTNWMTINSAPKVADNGGSAVVTPNAITRAAVVRLRVYPRGTMVAIRMKYETAASAITDPVIQAFGIDSADEVQRLLDAAGIHALTLTTDGTNDVRDGTYSYTAEVEVDAKGCLDVICAVQTAAVGTDMPDPVIQARVF